MNPKKTLENPHGFPTWLSHGQIASAEKSTVHRLMAEGSNAARTRAETGEVGKEWKRCFFLGKHDHQPWGLSRR